MIGIAERVKPALWFPGRNDDALVGDVWRNNVAYYPLWGGAGLRAMDLSGNGNHGTLTDMDPATDWVTTEVGMALDFDGNNDYINIPDTVNNRPGQSNWTISVMLWAADADQQGTIISKRVNSAPFNQIGLYIGDETTSLNPGKRLQGIIIGTDATSDVWWYATPNVIDGKWHHIVFTRDQTGAAIFVDGVAQLLTLIRDSDTEPQDIDNTEPWYIGYNNGTVFGTLQVADVGIWNRALSAGEIAYLAANPFVMIQQPDFSPFWDVVSAPPVPVVVTGAAPGITIADDTIGLLTAIPNPGMTISDLNPTVIVEQ